MHLEERQSEYSPLKQEKQVEPKLEVNNITARWQTSLHPTLSNISVSLKPGDLLLVIGPVGSGKSSLLMTLLKELSLESGKIQLEGSLSYAAQQSWCISDTVRNNILFGSEFNQDRYDRVVRDCALQRDFQLMEFGDQTLVSEAGSSLSGGQRARINLARAIYRNSDIVLLDDPLSAVDARVGMHIFEKYTHLLSMFQYL